MRAVRLLHPGDLGGLQWVESPTPTPPYGHVLVRVRASSLNFRDLAAALGQYPGQMKSNLVVLSDGAGDVEALGEGVTRCKLGDRVAMVCNPYWVSGPMDPHYQSESLGFSLDGVLSDYLMVSERGLVSLPDTMSYEHAASLPCAGVSAWTSLVSGSPIGPGQTVLTLGTGGVSIFAVQFARMLGAEVISTTSSPEKAELLHGLGARDVLNYNDVENWGEKVRELTGGLGVDRVIEIGGSGTFLRSIDATRPGGVIALVGFVTGFEATIDPVSILARSLSVYSISVGSRLDFQTLVNAMGVHGIKPVIDSVFPMADFVGAFRRLASGKHVGKVVIVHD